MRQNKNWLFIICLMFALMVGSLRATAQDTSQGYADPTWANLLRAAIRFNAIDMSEQVLIDEYTIISECNIYKAFYRDDFKWNQVRETVRQSIGVNISTYPTKFHYNTPMQLDRYDFETKIFRFKKGSTLVNVNTFLLGTDGNSGCNQAPIHYLPHHFRAVLESPLYLDGLPLSEEDARALLDNMTKDHNSDRLIYASYNVSIMYIEHLHKGTKIEGTNVDVFFSQKKQEGDTMRYDVKLDSIDFYEDPQRTKLVYHYLP